MSSVVIQVGESSTGYLKDYSMASMELHMQSLKTKLSSPVERNPLLSPKI